MTQVYALDIDDVVKELSLGRATVKFMLERFSGLLPCDTKAGRPLYGQETVSRLFRIKDLMDQGLVPTQIEAALADLPSGTADTVPREDVRMSRDALGFIQNLFQDIKTHQSRIAQAHEKRAQAEERKAVAIEKRAQAEEKKAQAMNNIAAALQEMSRQRPADAQAMEVAGHAAQALTMNDTRDLGPETQTDTVDLDEGLDDADLDDLFSPPESGGALNLENDPEDFEPDDLDLADLAREIAAPDEDLAPHDDLTQLVDEQTCDGELDDLLEDPGPLPDLDALDDLDPVDDSQGPGGTADMDDLSRLIDLPAGAPAPDDIDDLSRLVDQAGQDSGAADTGDMDDLSALVDKQTEPDLDDLSALVDKPTEPDLDDLSRLVGPPDAGGPDTPAPLDDLSRLVEASGDAGHMDDLSALVSAPDADRDTGAEAAEPSLKPSITPEEDMAKYKAAVMKIIIGLKDKGLSAGQTTDRLNRDQVPTLSGKPRWRETAIAKIYGFIDSAQ